MEYYAGYLMPVQLDADAGQRPCKDASKLKKRIKSEIGGLEQRIKLIEGRLHTQASETKPRRKQEDSYNRSLNKRRYKVIENEYHDYNLKAENEKLRQQNRLLNEYFEIFSKKYRDNKAELETLRQQNTRLNALCSKYTHQTTSQNDSRPFKQRSASGAHSKKQDLLDKYVYGTPPYEEDRTSSKEEQFSSPRLNLIKCSEVQTKIATNYDDSYDFAKTTRSAMNTGQSGLM